MGAPSAFNILATLTRQATNAPVSGPLSPTANGQLFVYVIASGSANSEKIPTITGGGSGQGAWSNIFTLDPAAASKVGTHLFTSTTGAAPGTAGTITTTFQSTSSPTDATIVIYEIVSNYNGTAGLVTVPIVSGTATGTNRVTLSATPVGANDRVALFYGGRNPGTTPPTLGTDASFTNTGHFEGTAPVAAYQIEEVTGYSGTTADVSLPGAIANNVTAVIFKGTAGGVVLTQTNTDDGGVTDSVSISMVRGVPQTDLVGLIDSNIVNFIRGVAQTDDAGLTDVFQVQVFKPVNQTDDSGLTDSVAISMVRGVAQSDLVGLTDNISIAFIRRLTVDDVLGLSDSSMAQVFPPPAASGIDLSGLTDSFTVQLIGGHLVAGTIMDQIMASLIGLGFTTGTCLDRERARLVAATGVANFGAGKTIDDLYSLNNERNRIALESVAIIPKT